MVIVQIFQVEPGKTEAFVKQAEETFARYRAAGAKEAGVLITLDRPNNFPRLPVRADGPHLVWLGVVEDKQALDARFAPVLAEGRRTLAATGMLRGEPELVLLDPTERSRLRWLPEWKE
jgi:hypothetical protein